MKYGSLNLRYLSSYSSLQELILLCYEFLSKKYSEASNSHDLEHTIRVTYTCIEIGDQLNADMDVLIIAALFHDLGRPYEEKTGQCHAEIGAEMAKDFLLANNYDDLIEPVTKAIYSHRYSKNIEPESLEGKILQDADMLDALGSIGLYRTISYSVENNRDLKESKHHFYEKLLLLPSRMHFKITKKLALERVQLLKLYVNRLEEEIAKSDFLSLIELINSIK